jgi:hypothetical protein
MFTQPRMSGEPYWRQMMELESRKEVIEGWLSSPDTPSQLGEVLQEMLAATERHLREVRSQGPDNLSSSPRLEAG